MDGSVLIIGTGAQAKYALEIFYLIQVTVVGLISLPGETPPPDIDGVAVIGGLEDFKSAYSIHGGPALLLCSSRNKTKEELVEKLSVHGPSYANALHPSAIVARTARLGHGVILNANAVIQPFARIGNHSMIHAGVIVEHDCFIEDYVNLAPQVALAGYVKVGRGTTVYTGAVVAPRVEIGEYSVIGAGGVVLNNIGNGVTAVGVPVRVIRQST